MYTHIRTHTRTLIHLHTRTHVYTGNQQLHTRTHVFRGNQQTQEVHMCTDCFDYYKRSTLVTLIEDLCSSDLSSGVCIMYGHAYTHAHTLIDASAYTHTCVYIHTYIHVCMYTHVYRGNPQTQEVHMIMTAFITIQKEQFSTLN